MPITHNLITAKEISLPAEAQAFKRACSCFGLGRYFYDFDAAWVDIDDKGRPKKAPSVAGWMVPDNWRNGQRPSGKAAASSPPAGQTSSGSNGPVTSTARNGNSAPSSATSNKVLKSSAGNGNPKSGSKPEGAGVQSQNGSDLDNEILQCHSAQDSQRRQCLKFRRNAG